MRKNGAETKKKTKSEVAANLKLPSTAPSRQLRANQIGFFPNRDDFDIATILGIELGSQYARAA